MEVDTLAVKDQISVEVVSILDTSFSSVESFVSTKEDILKPAMLALKTGDESGKVQPPHNSSSSNSVDTVVEVDTMNSEGTPKKLQGRNETSSQTIATSTEGSDDWKAFMISIKNELQSSFTQQISSLKAEFKAGLEEAKENQRTFQSSLEELERKTNTNESSINITQNQLDTCKQHLNQVIDVTIKQDQMLNECQGKLDYLEKQVFKDVIRVTGIVETEGGVVKDKFQHFCKELLKIEDTIEVKDCYHVGKGKARTIVVQLSSYRDKGVIFGKAK